MIDIHCHILPNIDDGASDEDEALRMARIAVSDGIEAAIATPHVMAPLPSQEEIRSRVESLNALFTKHGVDFKVFPGAEVSYYSDLAYLDCYLLNDGPYLLLEFPHEYLPATTAERISQFLRNDRKLILAHPERNKSIIMTPKMLLELVGPNVFVQVSAESVTGAFGPDVQRCAMYLLKQGVVSFLATDAHSSRHRLPILSRAVKLASRVMGKDAAQRLVTSNPLQVINSDYAL